MKRKRHLYLLLASALLCLGASGCGSGFSKNSAVSATAIPSGRYELMEETMAAEEAYDTAAQADTGAAGLESAVISPADLSRKLIRTVDLETETKEFDQLLNQITEKTEQLSGYVESSETSGSSLRYGRDERYAYMTIRIPVDQLPDFIASVEGTSHIIRKTENTVDVTLSYADIESHKKTLQIEQDRLWELLAQAESTDSIIALEQRLSEIRYQLESYESQLRTYDNQVAYSTVHLSVYEVKDLTPAPPESIGQRISSGFTKNLKDVGSFFVDAFVFLVSSAPTLLLLVIVFLIAVKAGSMIRKRIKFPRRNKDKNKTEN